ncbi:uncharacterized protein ACHE_20955A [Aspergillus chevalieri]|uniref:Uncharacterized protein n=1 Tax=Aspergillus chevalieri TaxID=182096 RepID=A0A7R7VIT9_ASPCH|nr:uncharacterized protein ACHE_20955A [Aspergillus chevalieri]BCR85497.1 hypothetical protein ACHE_20955A [Aspergillus chevalieri]
MFYQGYSHPPIPSSMLDRDRVLDKESFLAGGYVVSFNKKSTKWRTPEKAAVRTPREEYVSPQNGQLIGTHHPALANQPYVSVKRDSFGRELHIVPRFLAPKVAVGIRILISGFALLVYRNVHDIVHEVIADWDRGIPKSLGGLTVEYMIKKLNPSVANKQSAGYYLAALTHVAMDAEKSLARFQLPEEFSALLDNVANAWAPYKDALDGEPVVTVSIETDYALKKVQEAAVEGVKYH